MIPVSVHGLSIDAPAGPVFRGLDLEVPAGEAIALVGHSGSGKSTLAHALLGDVPDPLEVVAGTVSVGGLDPLSLTPRELRRLRRRCAYVDQDPGAALPPHLTVRAILSERVRGARTAAPGGGPARGLADDDALRLLADLGLTGVPDILDRHPSQLSGGQRRRVGVAAGIAAQPELLIVDEPTAGVDAAAVALMMDTLRAARARTRATFLVITHDPAVADALADVTYAFAAATDAEDAPAEDAGAPGPVLRRPAPETGAVPPRPEPGTDSRPEPGDRSGALLEVRDLVVHRDGRCVVDGVSLSVGPGDAVALSGPSGSGKTTVLRAILGISPATSGRIAFDGGELAHAVEDRPRAVRSGFGWVPQESELALNPSVNVGKLLRRTGAPDAAVSAMLERLRLPAPRTIRRNRPGDLSGGQRQRLSIALALLRNPRVLLCDEPTSALDHRSAELVLAALSEARGDGMALILTSHDPAVLATAGNTVDMGASPIGSPGGPAAGAKTEVE